MKGGCVNNSDGKQLSQTNSKKGDSLDKLNEGRCAKNIQKMGGVEQTTGGACTTKLKRVGVH